MALIALATARCATVRASRSVLGIGVFGAALFYGDAVLTPAISVLSAVEGLRSGPGIQTLRRADRDRRARRAVHDPTAWNRRRGLVFRAGVHVLVRISRGGRRVEHRAGPRDPRSARSAVRAAFPTAHGFASFVVLGSVLLAITGAEALYAEIGHFGKRAIRIAWFGVAAPGLVLNYFGQGALLLVDPAAIREPVLPGLPGVGALSDGRARDGGDRHCFTGDDLRRLLDDTTGHPARLSAAHVHTPHVRADDRPDLHSRGELAAACRRRRGGDRLRLVVAPCVGVWRGSDGHDGRDDDPHVLRRSLRVGLSAVALRASPPACSSLIDVSFFAAALHKVLDGGWFPLALGAMLFTVMMTWRRGRELLANNLQSGSPPLREFLRLLLDRPRSAWREPRCSSRPRRTQRRTRCCTA